MLNNIMELIEKEEGKEHRTPFIDRNLWLKTQESLIDARSLDYPTIAMCLECDGECKQVQVVGLTRLYCGIKNREWRKGEI